MSKIEILKRLIAGARDLSDHFDSQKADDAESHLAYAESGILGDPADSERIEAVALALTKLASK